MSYEQNRIQLLNQYPAIRDLAEKAKKRIPDVAWAYLQTGTGAEDLLIKNRKAFSEIQLTPRFCKGDLIPNISTTLLGQSFSAPFGIAPIGLTGLMWPKAEIFLAKTANKYKIPYSLSTVATETPETLAPYIGDMGWFQLYPPRDPDLRRKILARAKHAGFHTLLVTADVPVPSRRERTKRAGLQTPPKITGRFIWQALTHPVWTVNTLLNGLPRLRTVEHYSEFNNRMSVAAFVQNQMGGNLSWEYCKAIRDEWEGPVIVKGLLHPADAEKAVRIGMDGIVVSNHGGRQFDGAPAALKALPDIVKEVKGKTAILFDSGIRSGLDILRAIYLGAEFVLLGRAFIYGVAALGVYGGDHVFEILTGDLKNNMMQFGIDDMKNLIS